MKAVLLVGGQGTRLRPLTCNRPKPLLPVANKPHLDHVLSLLQAHGVDEVIFAVQYLADIFEQYYQGSFENMKITVVSEDAPMGTAGAVKNVASHLTPGETFMVFNGDILTDLDLTAMLQAHRDSGSVCTIALTPVEDPSLYGVVDIDANQQISRFTEKPSREEATSNLINAGTYVLEYEVLESIPANEFYMFERGLFPGLLANNKPLYGFPSDCYWLDIGAPAKYLQAQHDLLLEQMQMRDKPDEDHHWLSEGVQVDSHAVLRGPVMLGKNVRIDAGATLVGPVVLGSNTHVKSSAYLEGCLVWEDSVIGEHASLSNSIIGCRTIIGDRVHLEGGSVVADDCVIDEDNRLAAGIRVWPGVHLAKQSITF